MKKVSDSKLIQGFIGTRSRLRYFDTFNTTSQVSQQVSSEEEEEPENFSEEEMARLVLEGRSIEDKGERKLFLEENEKQLNEEQHKRLVAGVDAEEVREFAERLVDGSNDSVDSSDSDSTEYILQSTTSTVSTQEQTYSDEEETDEDTVSSGEPRSTQEQPDEFQEQLRQAWVQRGKTELFGQKISRGHRRYVVYDKNEQGNYSLLKGDKNVTKMTGEQLKKTFKTVSGINLLKFSKQGEYKVAGDMRVVLVSVKKDNPPLPQVIQSSKTYRTPSKKQLDYAQTQSPDTFRYK